MAQTFQFLLRLHNVVINCVCCYSREAVDVHDVFNVEEESEDGNNEVI